MYVNLNTEIRVQGNYLIELNRRFIEARNLLKSYILNAKTLQKFHRSTEVIFNGYALLIM